MISQHIRSNVVAYVALFLALTGTATALEGKNSVKSKDIAKAAVTTPKLRGQSVTGAKIAPGAVTGAQLAGQAVGPGQLAPFAVGTGALAAGAVTADKIAAATITGAELDKGALALGPESFGSLPVLKVFGELSQTAPAIASTTVALDTGNVEVNTGGFTVDADSAAVPIDGLYYARLVVPWGQDPAAAERQFVALLEAGGDLVEAATASSTQPSGFNYGPSTDAAGVVALQAGDEISGEVYYSGSTPSGGIPLAGLGLTTLEVFWLGPG